ncbi:MAG: L,D-transpeptidase family protein [Lachnospiraceae bacterium]|nr:L,D-transpeptidase family protein [Lachnospiraceae bacterium]
MATKKKTRKLTKKQRENRRIRIATYLAFLILIAIVVIIVVSCNHKKANKPSDSTTSAETTTVSDDIPKEYVEPTYYRDAIEITDEWATVGDSTDYSLYVNTALNATTLYKVDGDKYTPLRVMACSTGRRDGHETPEGTFYLGEWIIGPACEWCYMADGTEGLYAYRIIDGINNDIMFHSVPFLDTDHGTIEYEEYNKLGNYASMGCIRMSIADVRYLGQLCAGGTEVYIYYDENEVLPMEKPVPLFIPPTVEEVRGWDPTDPLTANPWHSYTFTMKVPNSIEVEKDSAYSEELVLNQASATDCYGNDVSEYIACSGTVDTSAKGKYTVTVTLDLGQYHGTKNVVVVVK